jgi:class 3 adenylate cyclase
VPSPSSDVKWRSVAAAGELLVSIASAERASLVPDGLERRTPELKGHEEPIDVVILMRPAVAT